MAWRPRNETPQDLENEAKAAEYLSELWAIKVTKLSEYLYPVDWAFSRNDEVVAFAEYKKRNRKYDSALLCAAKYFRMVEWGRITKLPVLLIIEWPGELMYINLTEEQLDLKPHIGGNSRGQNGDISPVVFIPCDKFVKVDP
jgi:hypothetical protein